MKYCKVPNFINGGPREKIGWYFCVIAGTLVALMLDTLLTEEVTCHSGALAVLVIKEAAVTTATPTGLPGIGPSTFFMD